MDYNYPLRKQGLCTGIVIEFTSLNYGIVITPGTNKKYAIGTSNSRWLSHTDTSTWADVKQPEPIIEFYL